MVTLKYQLRLETKTKIHNFKLKLYFFCAIENLQQYYHYSYINMHPNSYNWKGFYLFMVLRGEGWVRAVGHLGLHFLSVALKSVLNIPQKTY